MFELPENLPATLAEVSALRDQADAEINVIRARHAAGEVLSAQDAARLRYLLDAHDTLAEEADRISAAEQAHNEELAALLTRAAEGSSSPAAQEPGPAGEEPAQPEPDEEQVPVEVVVAATPPVTPLVPSFSELGQAQLPARTTGAPPAQRWRMHPSCPGYQDGPVGFAELARGLDSVAPGSQTGLRPNRPNRNLDGRTYAAQVIASLAREGMPLAETPHELLAAIDAATDETRLPGGSLIASGGWCSPSEQLYDFCPVPTATDLLSLPELAYPKRGGIRWPKEPEWPETEDFQFFFTEAELMAEPPPVKPCIEVPCPDEFEELRLAVVGYCVEAGILQAQGWPELIETFLKRLLLKHLKGLSRRGIKDMVAGSTKLTVPDGQGIGAASSVLNALSLAATNLRLHGDLGRGTTIEGVAPSWFAEVLRADLAMRDGRESATDAEITGWLSGRGIALQFVGDWQTGATGEPGNLATLQWPETVQILLYPKGTWFRVLRNIIELGVMYPKEQLQVNRYTVLFTEDAYAVGKRCGDSLLVEVPICVSGAVGARQTVDCNAA